MGVYIVTNSNQLWGPTKFNLIKFFWVMGIFDWSITKKFNQALDNPKIDILHNSLLWDGHIGYKSRELRAKDIV